LIVKSQQIGIELVIRPDPYQSLTPQLDHGSQRICRGCTKVFSGNTEKSAHLQSSELCGKLYTVLEKRSATEMRQTNDDLQKSVKRAFLLMKLVKGTQEVVM